MLSKGGKKSASNILLLTIPKESAEAYYKMTDLCYLRVAVSDYVRLDIPQCHRCQRFGHASQLCNRAYKCVRCGCAHQGAKCTAETCKCANCGGEHPSSYKGCPSYLAAKARNPVSANPKSTPNPNNRQPTRPSTDKTEIASKTTPRGQPPKGATAPTREDRRNPSNSTEQTQANVEAWRGFRRQETRQPAQATADTEDDSPIKDILTYLRALNLKDIWKTIKDTIQRLKDATDATDKLVIVIEAITSFF